MKPIYARPTEIPGRANVFVNLPTVISNIATLAFTTQRRPMALADFDARAIVRTMSLTAQSRNSGELWRLPQLSGGTKDIAQEHAIARDILAWSHRMMQKPVIRSDASIEFIDELTRTYTPEHEKLGKVEELIGPAEGEEGEVVSPTTRKVTPFGVSQKWGPSAATPKKYLHWKEELPQTWRHDNLNVVSPWSRFSLAWGIACFEYDRALLTDKALLPPETAVVDGYSFKFRQLSDDRWIRSLSYIMQGMGVAYLVQGMILTTLLQRRRWEIAQATRRFKYEKVDSAVTNRINADFEQILSLPAHPLTKMVASGFLKDVTIMTNDGEMPGILIPTHADAAELMAKDLKPAGDGTPGSRELGYAKIAEAATKAANIPEVAVWGSKTLTSMADTLHISWAAASVRGLKDVLEQVQKISTGLSWTRGPSSVETSGFAQSGADFLLSDGASWSGNIMDAVFGLRPVVGMNNVKLMGYDLRFEDSFSTGDLRINEYFVPVDAPYSTAALGSAEERRFLPQSAVMERVVKGMPIYTKYAPPTSALTWASNWYKIAMPKGVVAPYYKMKVTEKPAKYAANVIFTSWDPVIKEMAKPQEYSEVAGLLYDLNDPSDTILIEGDFRMRVPQMLARATTVLIEDPSLEIIARSHDQLGTLVYGDEDPTLARRGDEVLTKLVKGIDDKAQDGGGVEPSV